MLSESQISELAEVVFKAGEQILKHYSGKVVASYKADNSPVTQADIDSNNILNEFFAKTGIPVISEENNEVLFEVRKNWKQFWCVDPLDGTKEFLKGNGEFAVNIALVENNLPIFGLIYQPTTNLVWFNYNDKVFKTKLNGVTQIFDLPLEPCSAKPNKQAYKLVTGRSSKPFITNYYNKLMLEGKEPQIEYLGASLKFCQLLEGEANEYPRFAPSMEWDTAAGHALLNVVGVQLIDLETGKELEYNKKSLLNNNFIAKI